MFPDGELTGSGRIITEAQNVGLEVVHEENLRHHYALTLRDWCRNLVEHWDEAVEEVGLPTAKVWGLYMAGSRLGFETTSFSCTRCWRSSSTTRAATAACRCGRGGRPSRYVDLARAQFTLQQLERRFLGVAAWARGLSLRRPRPACYLVFVRRRVRVATRREPASRSGAGDVRTAPPVHARAHP